MPSQSPDAVYMRAWRAAHPGAGAAITKRYRAAHPERIPVQAKAWRLRHPETYQAGKKAWTKAHPEKVSEAQTRWLRSDPEHASWVWRRASMLHKYGLTEESYKALLARQGGRCAICKRTPEEIGVKFLAVDHDHRCCPRQRTCGRCVRGLLCARCNMYLGWFEAHSEGVIDYTERSDPEHAALSL